MVEWFVVDDLRLDVDAAMTKAAGSARADLGANLTVTLLPLRLFRRHLRHRHDGRYFTRHTRIVSPRLSSPRLAPPSRGVSLLVGFSPPTTARAMRSRRVRARDGRRDDTATTTPRRRERMKFRSIRAPSSRRPSSSRTRRPRAAVDADRAFDPTMRYVRCDAMRCDAMRCVPLALPPARVARALSDARTAFIVEVVVSIAVGTLRARVSRRSRARDVRGPPPEPYQGRGRGIDRSIDRPIGKTPCTYGVVDRTLFSQSGVSDHRAPPGPMSEHARSRSSRSSDLAIRAGKEWTDMKCNARMNACGNE